VILSSSLSKHCSQCHDGTSAIDNSNSN